MCLMISLSISRRCGLARSGEWYSRNVITQVRADYGVSRDDADLMIQDKSWMIDMKAEIMRRAQEPSDDEEEEAEYDAYGEKIVRKKRLEPFEDDAWDGLDEGLTSVRVAGDGEADEESDGQEDTVGSFVRLYCVIIHNHLSGAARRPDPDNPRISVPQGPQGIRS